MIWIWYVVAGIVSGVVAGMGMGGGTLLIPILTIFFSVAQATAQGINLFAFLPCAVVSLIIHIKNKLVDFKVGLLIIASGLISSILGSILAVNTTNKTLKILFGIFLLLIGVYQGTVAICGIIKNKKNQFKKIKCKKIYRFNQSKNVKVMSQYR